MVLIFLFIINNNFDIFRMNIIRSSAVFCNIISIFICSICSFIQFLRNIINFIIQVIEFTSIRIKLIYDVYSLWWNILALSIYLILIFIYILIFFQILKLSNHFSLIEFIISIVISLFLSSYFLRMYGFTLLY